MEKRIKDMYNDCAKSFLQYVQDHNMAAYNERSVELVKKYGCELDIKDLLFWWAARVQKLHDVWEEEHGSNT